MSAPKRGRRVGPSKKRSGPPSSDTLRVGAPFPLADGRSHPRLGLGLWALGRWQPEDEARTKACLGRGLERGVGWFDTAEVYGAGRSERLLGDVLARAAPARRNPFISTKVSWEHLRPSQVRAALIGSLHRLGRTEVDLYLIHGPDPHVSVEETMRALSALHDEGKARSVGVSNFSVEELDAARRALEPLPLVVNQVQYNLLNFEEGEALGEYCRRHQIVLEAYTPLARGLLTGRYLDNKDPPAELRRWAHEPFGAATFQVVRDRARKLRALAEGAQLPMASLALHWLEQRGVAAVFGASRPEQVDLVVEAWNQVPPSSLLAEAEAIGRGEHD